MVHRPLRLLPGLLWLVASLAFGAPGYAQSVESLFPAGPPSDGYYVPHNGAGLLEVGVLVDFAGQRPVTIGGRILAGSRLFATQKVRFDDDFDLQRGGRAGSGGPDEWYLQGFFWNVSCSADGTEVAFNGEVIGKSPAEFAIEVGVVVAGESESDEEPVPLKATTTAITASKFILCGELAPLPAIP